MPLPAHVHTLISLIRPGPADAEHHAAAGHSHGPGLEAARQGPGPTGHHGPGGRQGTASQPSGVGSTGYLTMRHTWPAIPIISR